MSPTDLKVRAGRLDRLIRLQTATKAQDPETGEEVLTWDTGELIPAQWFPGTTRESYQAQQRLAAYIDGVFRIRYRERPSPDVNQIVWEDRTYDVKPAMELGRHDGWEIPVVARGE